MDEKVIFDRFHKIVLVEAEMKGKKVTRERLILKNAVAAIVVDERNRIGLVSQFRPTINARIWELPAGVLDKPHLTPMETLSIHARMLHLIVKSGGDELRSANRLNRFIQNSYFTR